MAADKRTQTEEVIRYNSPSRNLKNKFIQKAS